MVDPKLSQIHAALAREERLAAKLRENLRRRKAQAKALDAALDAEPDGVHGATADSQMPGALPKVPPKS